MGADLRWAQGPLLVVFPIGSVWPSAMGGPSLSVWSAAGALGRSGRVLAFVVTTDFDGRGRPRLHDVPAFPRFDGDGATARAAAYYRYDIPVPLASSAMAVRAAREFRRGMVVHGTSVFSPPMLLLSVLAVRRGAGVVVTPHGELGAWPMRSDALRKRALLMLWRRHVLAGGRAVVQATCEQEAQEARRCLGTHTSVHVIPNALPQLPERVPRGEARSRFGIPDRSRMILSLGRVDPKKNIEALVRAFARLREAGRADALWIVGDEDAPGYVAVLQDLAAMRGASDAVHFVGHTTGRDKDALYAAADSFCLPSHHENFGMVVLEALAQECPVVASRNTPWDVLERAACGRWVEPTPECLEEALGAILDAPEAERWAMGARGRALVEREFLQSTMVDRYLVMYEEALHRAS